MMMTVLLTANLAAQKKAPQSVVSDRDGNTVDLSTYLADGKPKIVSLWATWCGPCRMELNALKASYPKWQAEHGVEIVAISVDRGRMVERAKKMLTPMDGSIPSCTIATTS